MAPSASLAHRLVSRFDPAVIGVIYYVGNLVWDEYEDYQLGLQILGRYLHHMRLKNAVLAPAPTAAANWPYAWSPLDRGLVPVPRVLDMLRHAGYSGWISLEDLSAERDPLATLRHNAAVLAAMPEAAWPRRHGRGAMPGVGGFGAVRSAQEEPGAGETSRSRLVR